MKGEPMCDKACKCQKPRQYPRTFRMKDTNGALYGWGVQMPSGAIWIEMEPSLAAPAATHYYQDGNGWLRSSGRPNVHWTIQDID